MRISDLQIFHVRIFHCLSLFLSTVVLKDLEEDTAMKVSGSVESDLLAD